MKVWKTVFQLLWSKWKQQCLTVFQTDINGAHIFPNHYGDTLTFHLAPP